MIVTIEIRDRFNITALDLFMQQCFVTRAAADFDALNTLNQNRTTVQLMTLARHASTQDTTPPRPSFSVPTLLMLHP